MALGLDDKLLGEKMDYYCSSSEDEGERDDDEEDAGSDTEKAAAMKRQSAPTFIPEPELKDYNGHCTNTGPKGVINDWRRFKQLETEKKQENDLERLQLAKKLSITCRSHLDDEKEKEKDEEFMQMLGELEDEFIKQYRQKRIEEMRKMVESRPVFGKVYPLTKAGFITAIDKEKPQVTIIIHVYEDSVAGCEAMEGCLKCLATEYREVKFCKIKASQVRLSRKFSTVGVPALLIYKGGELIGNFVRVSDDLGDDFFATDVQSYLIEHGILQDKSLVAGLMGPKITQEDDEGSGSDFDVD
ncbi:phosducin-like protein [Tubulanus polymorphus]|uniref:phosducin-like protein n=1 Tax=Tubulanus polymorphus TaxID=672921 RepID=UPI003DA43EB6